MKKILLYKNGERVNYDFQKKYYYHSKENVYKAVTCSEKEQVEMYKSFAVANKNVNLPDDNSINIAIDNVCVSFKNNAAPRYFIKGKEYKLNKGKLGDYSSANKNSYKIHICSLQLQNFGEGIEGYQFALNGNSYAIIYGENLKSETKKHIIKFLETSLKYNPENLSYLIEFRAYDYELLVDYLVRKDEKSIARKEIWKQFKNWVKNKDFDAFWNAVNHWWLLH